MPKLYPEDQEKVDAYLAKPHNSVQRSEFKPLRLLLIIFLVLGFLTLVSFGIASYQGLI